MTHRLNLIELRLREILECVDSLNEHVYNLDYKDKQEIFLQLKRIMAYANDAQFIAITYSAALTHTRREKRRRHRKNIQKMNQLTKSFQNLRISDLPTKNYFSM